MKCNNCGKHKKDHFIDSLNKEVVDGILYCNKTGWKEFKK